MRRLLKFCLISLAILVSLFTLTFLTLRLALPQAKLRSMILEQIRTHLHRDAQLNEIHLWINGLTIERLRLSETPDFNHGTLIYIESTRVRWSWWPLWRPPLLKEIVFNHPDLHFMKPVYDALRRPGPIDEIRILLNDFTSTKIQGSLFINQQPEPYEIAGSYRFNKGIMTLDSIQVDGHSLHLTLQGIMEAATAGMAIDAHLNSDRPSVLGEMDVNAHLTGTLGNPKVRVESLKKKAFKAVIKNLLETPIRGGH
ncbi:MAG: hypothetical protein WC859_00930 [Elusimicrobiota bacterium]|jgi:uncharacterized protein involved in outer membrane biogenesis